MANEDSLDKALKAHLNEQLERILRRRPGSAADEEAARRRAEALGVRIDMIGGNCPVQAEGYFDDKAFYFRAKYSSWLIEVGPREIPHCCDEWEIERDYGADDDAGWMPIPIAIGFICDGVEAYRVEHGTPSPVGERQYPPSPRPPEE